MGMICDLIYWQIPEVAGWQVQHLPMDVLANFWSQIQKRRLTEINAYNYSAAVVADLSQVESKRKLKVERWLPYDLGDENQPKIGKNIAELLKELSMDGTLPPLMIKDLYKYKIITPG